MSACVDALRAFVFALLHAIGVPSLGNTAVGIADQPHNAYTDVILISSNAFLEKQFLPCCQHVQESQKFCDTAQIKK